jgi:hypothetical protein
MSDFASWIIFGLFLLFIVGIGVLALVLNKRRRRELEELAADIGFVYIGGRDYHSASLSEIFFSDPTVDNMILLDVLLQGMHPFGQGHSRRMDHLMVGERHGFKWSFFDYFFTTGSGKNQSRHSYSILLAQTPYAFPNLLLRPENLFTRIGSALGMQDLKFELEAFNRRYNVRCDERQRAYDLLHPQMIDYLMAIPVRHWQFRGVHCVIVSQRLMGRHEILRAMEDVSGFMERIPKYVQEDIGLSPS